MTEQQERSIHDEEVEAFRARTTYPAYSPWARRAQEGTLPAKALCAVHTDVRTCVVRESTNDILRRTLPVLAEEV
jgi:hypothetical protein